MLAAQASRDDPVPLRNLSAAFYENGRGKGGYDLG
jgi:hypothetical protein